MKLRYGTMDDAAMLSKLGTKTFFDTFVEDNTPENMAAYLRASFSPEIQLAELSAPGNIFLIVETENKPIGFAQLILDSLEESVKGSKTLEIRRIYAVKEYLGTGVGKTLMNAALREAKQRSCDSVWLGVWEKNPRAISFYRKWGFREVGTHIFNVGNDPQMDLIMELMLAEDELEEK